jgi:8-oxo-dGTP pyrophosphatase MutT (NUDIX family)
VCKLINNGNHFSYKTIVSLNKNSLAAKWFKLIYEDVFKRLSGVLKPISEEQGADAAVALIFKLVNRDIRILFVKRVDNPVDPWSGQMALPGGKRDLHDQNLKQTVIRETLEETNIDLLCRCRFLGVMAALRSTQRAEMRILPFVILLEHQPSIILNKKELEGFVWISLKELVQHKSAAKFSFGEFPAYIIGSNIIWGLTYRILENFIHEIKRAGLYSL